MKNVCIVGYGAIGPLHAECLMSIEDVRIYGICDIDMGRAKKGASEYKCKAFYSLEECLKDDEIDSIHICTPHYLHYEMIDKCLMAGKTVVAEKPVAMKKEEFFDLLFKYSKRPLYPVMQNRTNACVIKMKEIIRNNLELGQLKTVKGILTWHRDDCYYNSAAWRGTKLYEGGGVLINQAIHTLDLIIYLAGNVKCVQATTSNKSLKGVIEVEDTVDALIRFENGTSGIFYATNAYGENSGPQIEFEYQNASLHYVNGKLYRNGELICCDEQYFLGKEYWGSGHMRLFRMIYMEDRAFAIEDIENTMRTMYAMYDSAASGDVQYI